MKDPRETIQRLFSILSENNDLFNKIDLEDITSSIPTNPPIIWIKIFNEKFKNYLQKSYLERINTIPEYNFTDFRYFIWQKKSVADVLKQLEIIIKLTWTRYDQNRIYHPESYYS